MYTDIPKRKPNRLKEYDYSSPGVYFITICTQDHVNLFWENAGEIINDPEDVRLSEYGKIVDSAIRNISLHYPAITIDSYTVMPNHIHLLLQINTDENGRAMLAPTISTVVQQMKGYATKQIGHSIWQKLFHDHVIRGERDYLKIWEYIKSNPSPAGGKRFALRLAGAVFASARLYKSEINQQADDQWSPLRLRARVQRRQLQILPVGTSQ